MWIDLTCPAEILRVELPTAEAPEVRLTLNSLADRSINSCEATVKILDGSGQELGRAVHRARALTGRPHGTFQMTLPMEPLEGARGAEARLDKIWFVDNDVWRRSPERETEYEENALPPGNDLNALRYVAGPGAVGFPSQQAALWVCVCGRPNANREGTCARCGRGREFIFQQYNRNAVLRQVNLRERQLDLQTRGAREEAARLQRIREAEYDRKQARRARRRRGLISLGAVALLGAAVYWGGIPLMRRYQADRALEAGQPEQAEQILLTLENFPGAGERLIQARLALARREAEDAVQGKNAPEEETLLAALALLRGENATEADRALADRADLKRAESLLAAGDWDGAEALLDTLPEELDGREALKKDCAYARAAAAMEKREYGRAREIFLSLGDWREAADRAKDCLYEPAIQAMEAGDYEGAMALLRQISDYQDSGDLIRQCLYLKGMALEEEDPEAARQAYLSAGGWEDAADRARAIRWKQAEKLLAEGNYAGALPIYQELDGDGNAREKWLLCATEMARAAYKVRDYDLAAELLSNLPEDNRDTENIRTRALYLGAKAAAQKGETEKAIGMMERIAGYSDSNRHLRTWRLALAQEKMEAEAWEEARQILQPIAETYQAQRLLKQIESQIGPETTNE